MLPKSYPKDELLMKLPSVTHVIFPGKKKIFQLVIKTAVDLDSAPLATGKIESTH